MRETIAIPRSPHIKPTVFNEFFGLGLDESASPFLTTESRAWASNLTLRASILAAIFLLISFILSFHPSTLSLSSLFLVFVYFLAGIPSLIESIEDLISFDVNIDVLMTLAAFSSILIGSSIEGALLLVLFALSGSIADAVTAKAKGSLNHLNQLSPTKVTLFDDSGKLIERTINDIPVGTRILVRAGEVVPLDGLVVDGISSVNLVHLTGESLPVMKQIGDDIPAGARNLEGSLTIEVTHTSAESTLTKIIDLVTQAQDAKPQLQRWFDTLSRSYATSIIGLSLFFALIFPYFLDIPYVGMEGSIYRSLAFLIAASPCALIIALPIAYLSAISACAKKGILLKGGTILDALAKCSIIAFDKTGTLTTGDLTCKGIKSLNTCSELSENDIISIAYGLESHAVHPIARAICDYAKNKDLYPSPIKNFTAIPGYGVEGYINLQGEEKKIFLGRPEYVIERLSNEQRDEFISAVEELRSQGTLLAVLSIEHDLFIFSFQDTLRVGLPLTIARLKQLKQWKLLMLTGDHATSAQRIADEIGIDEFYADLKPENKLEYVSRLAQKEGLAMVGDGINDAPALARATVGICMGKVGSGAAVDAADVVLLQDNLERMDWLMLKARKTQQIVKENLTIAAGAIVIASLPALAGVVPLWVAVLMHEGGTVLVGLNALRLLRP